MKYFRLHSSALYNRKIQQLPPNLFRAWINAMCFAIENSGKAHKFKLEDLAFALRQKPCDMIQAINKLIEFGFLQSVGNGFYMVSEWTEESGRLQGDAWADVRQQVFERDGFTCQYCRKIGVRLECDHVIPVSRGGSHDESNLVTACFSCNRAKRDKTPEEWRVQ